MEVKQESRWIDKFLLTAINDNKWDFSFLFFFVLQCYLIYLHSATDFKPSR